MAEAAARRRSRGGGGAARRAERSAVSFETAKFIERNIPNFEVLTEAALFDGSLARPLTLPNLPGAAPAEEAPAPKPAATLIDKTKPAETSAEPAGEKPEPVQIAEGDADDLKRIKGIGPKNEDQLNELGIYTFAQIASWTPENVDWGEDFLSFPGRSEREDWIAQAKTLGAGAETEFSKRVDAGEVESSKDDDA